MYESLTPTMLALFQASWQAALLAAVVAALCRWTPGKIPPRLQFVLWGAVFVRLALPVLPASPLSAQRLVQWAGIALAVPESETNAAAVSPIGDVDQHAASDTGWPAMQVVQTERGVNVAQGSLRSASAEADRATDGFAASWPVLLITAWLVGFAVLCLRYWLQWRSLWRLSRRWQVVADPSLQQCLDDARSRMGVRRSVQLLLADPPVGPAMLGLLRPRIVLPNANLLAEQLQMLLLHEVSHVRRWDVLWDRLAMTVTALHWFNPAAWWALARLREAREQACDADVLRCLGSGQAVNYGRLVLGLADGCDVQPVSPVLVGATGSVRSLERRIEMIGEYRAATWKQSAIGVVAILLLALCGLTSAPPSAAEPAAAANPDSSAAPAATATTAAAGDYEISGNCTDENDQPLAGVRVRLVKVVGPQGSHEEVQEIKTGADGTFEFTRLPLPEHAADAPAGEVYYVTYYVLFAQSPGRATRVQPFMSSTAPTTGIALKLEAAGTLSGRVVGDDGKPVEGASVFIYNSLDGTPIDGVMMDVTDADGRYEISDARAWDPSTEKPQKVGDNLFLSTGECFFFVKHPQYAVARGSYKQIPSVVNVALQPGATVEGVVTDQVTGLPAAGASVCMQGTHHGVGNWHRVQTGADGRYAINSIAAGAYNVWVDATDRTSIAIDSLKVDAGQTYNRSLLLIEGSWIEGRVIDVATGEPITQSPEGQPLRVAAYGPSRPKSGAAVTATPVGPDGRFGLRVPPGRNYPYIMTPDVWQRTEDQKTYTEGIDIGDGELVAIEFRVLPEVPREKPQFSPIRLPLPVEEERAAAAAVRRLGGWYAVDEARHVVEVNMVYHYTKEDVRHDNPQTGTDEILEWVPQFPQLKRLFLARDQATDESLRSVSECRELEAFYAWDARTVTDAGVEHLRELKRLKDIHVGNSQISDRSLALFATLPELENLSLQGNRFTDAGVAQLVGLKSLKSLWCSSKHAKFTNEFVRLVVQLTNLEALDLQGIPVTDAQVRELAVLKNLKRVSIGGAPSGNAEAITDASLDTLAGFQKLESLNIQNCRFSDAGALKLAAVPNITELFLDATHLSDEAREQMRTRHPEKRIFFSKGRSDPNSIATAEAAAATPAQALQADCSCEFDQTPLKDITEFVSKVHQVPLKLDAGVDGTLPVTIKHKGTLKAMLEKVLPSHGLEYVAGETDIVIRKKKAEK